MTHATSATPHPRTWLVPAAAVAIFVAGGLTLVPRYACVISTDAISYITIAQRYLAGDVLRAVNGYWGPLTSWLMIPGLAAGLDAVTAGRVAALLLGAALLAALWRLAKYFGLAGAARAVFLFGAAPLVLYYVFHNVGADLPVATALAWYLVLILDPGYADRPRRGAACGLLGALGYLSKSYNFFFFATHFTLATLLRCRAARSRPGEVRALRRQYAGGMAVFLAIAGSWAGVISLKYGRPMISSTGSYAFAISSPEAAWRGGDPIRYAGFFPPLEGGPNAWEDPGRLPIEPWSPLRSAADLRYALGRSAGTARDEALILWEATPAAPAVFIAYVLSVLFAGLGARGPGSSGDAEPAQDRRLRAALAISAFVVYAAGFLPLYVVERYLWIDVLLLLLMGAEAVRWIAALTFPASPMKRSAAAAVMSLLLVVSFLPAPLAYLARGYDRGPDRISLDRLKKIGGEIRTRWNLHGNAASNDYFTSSALLAFFGRLPYWGTMRPDLPGPDLAGELGERDIRYFFLWGEGETELWLPPGSIDVTSGAYKGLRIIRLPRPPASPSVAKRREFVASSFSP